MAFQRTECGKNRAARRPPPHLAKTENTHSQGRKSQSDRAHARAPEGNCPGPPRQLRPYPSQEVPWHIRENLRPAGQVPHHTSQHARGYSGQPFCCTKGKLRPDEGQGLAAPRPLGGRAGTGKNAGNKSEHLVNTLHVLSPGQPVPNSAAGRLVCHWRKEKPEAGKPSPAGAPRPCLPSPLLSAPMLGWGLCRGPARSVLIPPARPAPLVPKLGLGPPPHQLGRPGSEPVRNPPGPHRPRPADSSPSPPPGREEETPRPSLGPPGGGRSKPRARSAHPRRVGRPEPAGPRPR